MQERILNFIKSLLSRKFLLAIALTYVAYNASIADGVVTEAELTMIISPILAFIGVEGWRDANAVSK